MSKPRSLTPEQITEAALTVLDESGLAAFSMRAVADHLGVGTMSLYRYVEDRAQLEIMVVDRVLAGVSLDLPPAPWRNRVELLFHRVRSAIAAHPEAMPLTITHRQDCAAIRRWAEKVLTVLTEAGVQGERRYVALRALLSYLIGSIELEYRTSLTGARLPEPIPDREHPLLAAVSRQSQRLSPAERFRSGLSLLLDGLAA